MDSQVATDVERVWITIESSGTAHRETGPHPSRILAILAAETMVPEAIGRRARDDEQWTREGNVWVLIAGGVTYHVFPWEEDREGDGA